MQKDTKTGHDTVLLKEAVEALAVAPGDVVVDATVGGAGHFKELYAELGVEGTLIGIDADRAALERARGVATRADGPSVHLVEGNFREFSRILDQIGIEEADKALFDLGWSGYQLDGARGFSFKQEEPLLMTYGPHEGGNSAADYVNMATEAELATVLQEYGEEQFAHQIARGIVAARKTARILSTSALVDVIMASTPEWYHHKRIHPATKTFQALRIAVNDELGALREALTEALARMSAGGRIAVISFHSIEDRIVKNMFRDAATAGHATVLTKKPVAPSEEELAKNPRARSAKLRVIEVADRSAAPASPYHSSLSYA